MNDQYNEFSEDFSIEGKSIIFNNDEINEGNAEFMAEILGMNLEDDKEYYFIAEKAAKENLPKNWKYYKNRMDEILFYNEKTNEVAELAPNLVKYKDKFKKLKSEKIKKLKQQNMNKNNAKKRLLRIPENVIEEDSSSEKEIKVIKNKNKEKKQKEIEKKQKEKEKKQKEIEKKQKEIEKKQKEKEKKQKDKEKKHKEKQKKQKEKLEEENKKINTSFKSKKKSIDSNLDNDDLVETYNVPNIEEQLKKNTNINYDQSSSKEISNKENKTKINNINKIFKEHDNSLKNIEEKIDVYENNSITSDNNMKYEDEEVNIEDIEEYEDGEEDIEDDDEIMEFDDSDNSKNNKFNQIYNNNNNLSSSSDNFNHEVYQNNNINFNENNSQNIMVDTNLLNSLVNQINNLSQKVNDLENRNSSESNKNSISQKDELLKNKEFDKLKLEINKIKKEMGKKIKKKKWEIENKKDKINNKNSSKLIIKQDKEPKTKRNSIKLEENPKNNEFWEKNNLWLSKLIDKFENNNDNNIDNNNTNKSNILEFFTRWSIIITKEKDNLIFLNKKLEIKKQNLLKKNNYLKRYEVEITSKLDNNDSNSMLFRNLKNQIHENNIDNKSFELELIQTKNKEDMLKIIYEKLKQYLVNRVYDFSIEINISNLYQDYLNLNDENFNTEPYNEEDYQIYHIPVEERKSSNSNINDDNLNENQEIFNKTRVKFYNPSSLQQSKIMKNKIISSFQNNEDYKKVNKNLNKYFKNQNGFIKNMNIEINTMINSMRMSQIK